MEDRSRVLTLVNDMPSEALDIQHQRSRLLELLAETDKKRLVEQFAIGGIIRANFSEQVGINLNFGVRPRGLIYLYGLLSTLNFDNTGEGKVGYRQVGKQFAKLRDAHLLSKAGEFAVDETISPMQYRAEMGLLLRELDTGRFVFHDQVPKLARYSYQGLEDEIQELMGFSIDEAIDSARHIESVLANSGTELADSLDESLFPRLNRMLSADSDTISLTESASLLSEDESFLTGLEIIEEVHEEIADDLDAIWMSRSAMLSDLPDTVQRSAFHDFVDEISLEPGSETSLNPGFRDLSEPNPMDHTPILEVNGTYHIVSNELLHKSIAERFYHDLRRNMDKERFGRQWGANAEEFIRDALSEVIPDLQVLMNGSYMGREGPGETDFVILDEDDLIVVECKTKRLTVGSRGGETNIVQDDLDQGLGKAQSQARRFIAELLREGSIDLTVDGTIHTITKDDYDLVHPVVVIRDSYDNLATADYSGLIDLDGSYPFVTDFYSMEAICRCLENAEMFVDYISQRRQQLRNQTVYSSDEIDYLGKYLEDGGFPAESEQVAHLPSYTGIVRERGDFLGMVGSVTQQ